MKDNRGSSRRKYMKKDKIKKARSTSQKGKIRYLGNHKKSFCRYCRPKLAIRLDKKQFCLREIRFQKEQTENIQDK